MKISVHIEYFELLDHWSWVVTVNSNIAYGFESDHDNAFVAAESALKDIMNERREA